MAGARARVEGGQRRAEAEAWLGLKSAGKATEIAHHSMNYHLPSSRAKAMRISVAISTLRRKRRRDTLEFWRQEE